MKTQASIKFGQRIRELREVRGLSQEEASFNCGINRTFYGCLERGEKSATINTIEKLAIGFKVSLKELFDYE